MDKEVKASKGLEGLTPWTWSQGGNIPGNHHGPATKVGGLVGGTCISLLSSSLKVKANSNWQQRYG